MAGIFLKWLVPGLVTVVAGTALALGQADATMTGDLTARAHAALVSSGFTWAKIAVAGRDAALGGTAPTRQSADDAVALLASVHGVRAVTASVAVAEPLRPFVFSASVQDGAISLDGGYPDDATHAAILAAASGAADGTRLASGAPAAFGAGAKFALAALADLDQGRVSLRDAAVSIEGRARSSDAFDSLQRLSRAVPAGIELAALKVAAPLVSPYVWVAKYDGRTVTVSGNAPAADLADRLRALAPAGVQVSTALSLASGEPSGFEANTLALLKSLLMLEHGEASIRAGAITLTGAPATTAIADAVKAAVAQIGGTAELAPPRLTEFALQIDKRGDGLVFTGDVPDAATKERLAGLAGADVVGLRLARGAPERFASALDFGLRALGHLADGRVGLRADTIDLSGRAATAADFRALSDMVGQGAPQGLMLGKTDLRPPLANPFVWTASKDKAGALTLSGYVPDEAARTAVLGKVAAVAADTTEIADGAPEGFAVAAGQGLAVLALLDSGTVTFDGTGWSIEGEVDTPQKGFAADAAYSAAGLRTAGWSYAVHQAAKIASEAESTAPAVSPYMWSATKSGEGAVDLAGYVPNQSLKSFAAVRAGSIGRDGTSIASGEPPGFSDDVFAGLDALSHLREGRAAYDGSRWRLTGTAASEADRAAAEAALKAGSQAGALWDVEVTVAAPAGSEMSSAASDASAMAASSGEASSAAAPDITSIEPPPSSSSSSSEPAASSAAASEIASSAAESAPSSSSEASSVEPPSAAPVESSSSSSAEVPVPPSSSSEEPSSSSSDEPPVSRALTPQTLEAAPPMPQTLVFEAHRRAGGPVALKGAVPAETTAADFAAIAGQAKPGGLTVTPDLPADFAASGAAGLNALTSLESGDLGFDGTRWWLRGKAGDQAALDRATAGIAALPNGGDWSIGLSVMAPIEFCRERVDRLATRNAIVFQAGKATLMASSAPVLDELAGALQRCPKAEIRVQGHTDADGDEDSNLALSVARAEAVIAELVTRGVDESRLYAEGYGESDPVAPNDTKENKAKNRRIGFQLSEE